MSSDNVTYEWKNRPEFLAVMARLRTAPTGSALVGVARAAILPIQNAAIVMAPYKTGTLRRSIHTEVLEQSQFSCMVATGTDLVYARRVEYGFNATDALGRAYHQPAQPYMRPAYAEQRDAAIAEATKGLKAIILGAV